MSNAQQAVLQTIIRDNTAMRRIDLTPDDFVGKYADVFAAMQNLAKQHQPIDAVTLAKAVPNQQQTLLDLFAQAFEVGNVRAYADIVRSESLGRQLMALASDVTMRAKDVEPTRLLAEIRAKTDALMTQTSGKPWRTLAELAPQVYREVAEAQDGVTEATVATGFPDIDRVMGGGFGRNNLTILAGRANMGKSTLAQNMSQNVLKRGGGVYVASVEMTATEWSKRLIAAEAELQTSQFHQRGVMSDSDFERFGRTVNQFAEYTRYFVDGRESNTPNRIAAAVQRLLHEGANLDLIVVDHMHDLKPDVVTDRHDRTLGDMVQTLKDLAKSTKVPVLLLAQLNRELRNRKDNRPTVTDLRDSGRIEEKADTVMLLHRDSQYEDREPDALDFAQVIFGKARHFQKPYPVTLGFQGRFSRFVTPTEEEIAMNRAMTRKGLSV